MRNFDDPKHRRDPLIHGASPRVPSRDIENVSRIAVSDELVDISKTNPWEDLKTLFLNPKLFFKSLAKEKRPSGWIYFKVLLVLFIIQAIIALSAAQNDISSIDEIFKNNKIVFNGNEHVTEQLRGQFDSIRPHLIKMQTIQPLLAPIVIVFSVMMTALSAFIFLPVFGLSRSRFSFSQILVILLFVRWFEIIEIVPFMGAFIAWLVVGILGFVSLSWVFDISIMKALLSAHMLGWLMAFAILGGFIAMTFGFLT